jgi:hypothetical protein
MHPENTTLDNHQQPQTSRSEALSLTELRSMRAADEGGKTGPVGPGVEESLVVGNGFALSEREELVKVRSS